MDGPRGAARLRDLVDRTGRELGPERRRDLLEALLAHLPRDGQKTLLGTNPPADRPLGVALGEVAESFVDHTTGKVQPNSRNTENSTKEEGDNQQSGEKKKLIEQGGFEKGHLEDDSNDEKMSTGSKPDKRPILNDPEQRTNSILDDTPSRFEIRENPKEDGNAPWWRDHNAGKMAVDQYGKIVEEEAKRQNVDPDLIKAIMYYENADGHKFGLDALSDRLGMSETVRPMSINPEKWSGLGLDRTSAEDPRLNIRASVTLVKRIIERVQNPTADKIGSIWNYVGRELVSTRGARIGKVFRDHAWEKPYEND